MLRINRTELVLSTSHFSPAQLQPRFLLESAMSGWANWTRVNLVPFRDLIRKWNFGVVVIGIDVRWLKPFGFFDADVLHQETAISVREDGELLYGEFRFLADDAEAAAVRALMRPIQITDSSLAARPSAVDPSLIRRFQPEEVSSLLSEQDHMRELFTPAKAHGHRVAGLEHQFRVHRADTEVADQWSFIDIPAYAAAAREELLLSCGEPSVAGALAHPLTSLTMKISRPLYVFDEARVVTDAYDSEDTLTFLHRIESGTVSGRTHATIIETLSKP